MDIKDVRKLSFEGLEENLDKEFKDTRVQLAKDAAQHLGYKKLAQAIAFPSALLFTLRKLQIEPFKTSDVSKYMTSKQKKGLHSGTKNGLFFLGLFAFGLIFSCMEMRFWIPSIFHDIVLALTTIVGTIGLIGGSLGTLEGWGRGDYTETRWRGTHIKEYDGTIPEHALDKAIQIKKELPAADFWIYQLEEEKKRTEPKRLPDPFLEVRYQDEHYMIDVWDEKAYEVKML